MGDTRRGDQSSRVEPSGVQPPSRSHTGSCWSGASEHHHNGLRLRVCVENLVAPLAPPAGLLVSTEGKRSVENVEAVDPDGASLDLLREGVGLGYVLGPDTCRQAVDGIICDRCGFVGVVEAVSDQHGAKDLVRNY